MYGDRLCIGSNCAFGKFFELHFNQTDHGKVRMGNNVIFRKFCIVYIEAGELSLADNVFFNNYCSVTCLGKIEIGAHSIFGEGVRLYDHNHIFGDTSLPVYEQGMKIVKITIGRNCWIGANTVILNNVSIGDGAVIGANNLIYKDVPAGALVKSRQEKILMNI